MALTKDDLHAIGSVIDERVPAIVKKEVDNAIETQVRPLVKEEVNGAIETQVRPLFEAQTTFIARGFADLKGVVKDTYVSRNKFEEKYRKLKTKLADLRKDVTALKQRRASA